MLACGNFVVVVTTHTHTVSTPTYSTMYAGVRSARNSCRSCAPLRMPLRPSGRGNCVRDLLSCWFAGCKFSALRNTHNYALHTKLCWICNWLNQKTIRTANGGLSGGRDCRISSYYILVKGARSPLLCCANEHLVALMNLSSSCLCALCAFVCWHQLSQVIIGSTWENGCRRARNV